MKCYCKFKPILNTSTISIVCSGYTITHIQLLLSNLFGKNDDVNDDDDNEDDKITTMRVIAR